ncbi:MAG: hydrogen gas-evolving membrane-bound hydrogenase subunit E, partial [Limisphaerales bacterium]
LTSGLPLEEHKEWLTAAMFLVVLGAFGKSAQFPFHFWLPNAMAAPTPVSAYLHSATMVKLGVFLCARVFPFFVGLELWPQLLAVVAFGTMVIASLMALMSHDLKAILAYSTVSQLGFLIGYYGLGPVTGVEYDYLHILNHVLYKGSMFMIVGAVAHATHERDIRKLGGLMKRAPLLGITCAIAAATMAGFPGTTGFLSKEMMFKEIFDASAVHGYLGTYASICVAVASAVQVAFSARIFMNIFMGKEPEGLDHHWHAPSLPLLIPPMLLAGTAFICGLAPFVLDKLFHLLTVPGVNIAPDHLVIWHGFTRELLISAIVVGIGLIVYLVGQKTHWRWADIPKTFRFDFAFEHALAIFSKGTKQITGALRSDRPVDYLPIIFLFIVAVFGYFFAQNWDRLSFMNGARLEVDHLRTFIATLIALAVVGAVILKRWTTQLISLSVAGFLTTFYFVLYQAPDLALTQILVEAVTLILILLLLGRFPKSAEKGEVLKTFSKARQSFNLLVSALVGLMMTAFILMVTNKPHPEPIGTSFLEETVPLAEGSNAVNTILVDFRGFDTMGEIAVLVIAMLGCLGLLSRYKRTAEEYKAGPMGPPGFGIDHKEPK